MFALFTFLLWLYALLRRRAERAVFAVLSAGPIPRHVAFIMDGNRRYARGKHMEVFRGHADGFQTLRRLLEVCLDLHIQCVSVYAFSIENFKRSPEEVNALMQLARDSLNELCEKGNLLDEYGVRLCVIGRTSLLPADVLEVVQKAERMTQHNDKAILNLCMPYTSRDEIATAIDRTVKHTLDANLDTSTITEHTITSHLMTSRSGSPPLDILVRTSGVRHLSDYLLWQCAEDTQIHFVSCLWPEFGVRHLLPILLAYQRKVWGRRRRGTRTVCVGGGAGAGAKEE